MSNTFFGLAVDCADAAEVARFWADVLSRDVAGHPTQEHAVVLVDDEGTHGPRRWTTFADIGGNEFDLIAG